MIRIERHLTSDLKPATKNLRNMMERNKTLRRLLSFVAIFGVSLIISDGVITPAQSVLGAIQGQSAKESTLGDILTIDRTRSRQAGHLTRYYHRHHLCHPRVSIRHSALGSGSDRRRIRTYHYDLAFSQCRLWNFCKLLLLVLYFELLSNPARIWLSTIIPFSKPSIHITPVCIL